MDTTSILAAIGASSGTISILINAITARRSKLAALRPKLNVDLTSDIINDKIVCHLEMVNVGTEPMNVKSMRLYVFDSGFNQNFLLGIANYSTNLFIYDNKILNKVYNVEVDFTYENLVDTIHKFFKYDHDEIRQTLTQNHFTRLAKYFKGLEGVQVPFENLKPVLFIRPFFLFEKNIEFYTKLKKMPPETFPQSVNIVLFDYNAYKGNWAKDPFALSEHHID